MEFIYDISAWVIPLLIAITLHEAAHGWMADKLGDPTARLAGRVSFNPLKHIDRFGTIVLPALLMLARSPFIFGFAKPVPVNFEALRNYRSGTFLVAFAGPGMNLILLLIAAMMLHLEVWLTPEDAPWIYMNIYRFMFINAVLALFNLLPVPPLDGGRMLSTLMPERWMRRYNSVERPGLFIVLLVLILPALSDQYHGTDFRLTERLVLNPALTLVEMAMHLTGIGNVTS